MNFEKLIFLPLDIPAPPDIVSHLDGVREKGIDEYNFVADSYRISPSIILMSREGKWREHCDAIPQFKEWAETELFPWFELSQMVVITTLPNASMAPHIDCSPDMFYDTPQHKFRCVLRGKVDTLRYIHKDGADFVPITDQPYIISGKWPHDMTNNFDGVKYTLCLGAPWEADLSNKKYVELLDRSYAKYHNQYMSYDNWKLPENYKELFNQERYNIPDESYQPPWA